MNNINKSNKINIILIEYINRNLGDMVIAECAGFFLREALQKAGIKNYIIHEYNMYNVDMEFVRNADLIVFAGGSLIKYKRERFHEYVPQIIEVAQKNSIPVYFNCVGVEGYDETDEGCVRLRKALNYSCVKGITVRDDFDTLVKYYLLSGKEWCGKVLDSAAFSSEVYKCRQINDAKKIGLGIVSDGLFRNYGFPDVTKEFQLMFWKEIISKLDDIGYQWEIFTNGLHEEYAFALEVLEYVGIKNIENYVVNRPAEGKELAQTISQYKGVIACRLHANIIAFSEGVPSIGLVWNDKLLQWGESIGYPERFIEVENLEAEHVIHRLQDAIESGCRCCTSEERNNIVEPLMEFVNKYGNIALNYKKALKQKESGWENILVANALGGKLNQYCGMNSPATVLEKYRNGFRWFEADIKLTSDNRLVCVNGWTTSLYNKIGVRIENDSVLNNGISYKQFMSCKYYNNHYDVMDYEMLIDFLRRMPNAKIILDARNNAYAKMVKIAEIIKDSIQKDATLADRIIVKVMSMEEFTAIKGLNLKLMYDIPSNAEINEKKISSNEIDRMCKQKCIEWISVRANICNIELIKRLKTYNKKINVSSCNSLSEINNLLVWGVDLIGTDYLTVNGLNGLTGWK